MQTNERRGTRVHGGSGEGDARESFSSKPFSPSYDQVGEVISVQDNDKSGSSATQEVAKLSLSAPQTHSGKSRSLAALSTPAPSHPGIEDRNVLTQQHAF